MYRETRNRLGKERCIARHGFTLIELLIVIAILVILAAVMFPTFIRAREGARRVTCLSNMKQLGMGMLMYAQDYDERYYGASGRPATPFTLVGIGWAGNLYPYVKNTEAYKCPNDPNKGSGSNVPVSYALNQYAASTPLAGHKYTELGVLFSEISGTSINVTDPQELNTPFQSAIDDSHALFWYEGSPNSLKCCKLGAAVYYARGAGVLWQATRLTDSDTLGPQPTQPRHFDGANYAFLDGHAKWIKAQAVRGFNYSYGPAPYAQTYINATDSSGAAYYAAD